MTGLIDDVHMAGIQSLEEIDFGFNDRGEVSCFMT